MRKALLLTELLLVTPEDGDDAEADDGVLRLTLVIRGVLRSGVMISTESMVLGVDGASSEMASPNVEFVAP